MQHCKSAACSTAFLLRAVLQIFPCSIQVFCCSAAKMHKVLQFFFLNSTAILQHPVWRNISVFEIKFNILNIMLEFGWDSFQSESSLINLNRRKFFKCCIHQYLNLQIENDGKKKAFYCHEHKFRMTQSHDDGTIFTTRDLSSLSKREMQIQLVYLKCNHWSWMHGWMY